MTTDLATVSIGPIRIGGFIGHGLYALNTAIRRVRFTRKMGKFVGFCLLTGVFGAGGAVTSSRLLNSIHAKALQSPIEKNTYFVEDAHGAGKFMVVRQGTTHLQLECFGSKYKDDKGDWRTGASEDCYEFKIGATIQLEKWDQGEWRTVMYIYKMTQGEGEYQYTAFRGDR